MTGAQTFLLYVTGLAMLYVLYMIFNLDNRVKSLEKK